MDDLKVYISKIDTHALATSNANFATNVYSEETTSSQATRGCTP